MEKKIGNQMEAGFMYWFMISVLGFKACVCGLVGGLKCGV